MEVSTLYRITVDIKAWMQQTDKYGRNRYVGSHTRHKYQKPIYTTSHQKVSGIRREYGDQFVKVHKADLTGLTWYEV